MELKEIFEKLEKEFSNQKKILNLIDLKLENINYLIKESSKQNNSNINKSIQRQCLRRIINYKKDFKTLLKIKNESFKNLKELVKILPKEFKFIETFNSFPEALEDKYNLIQLSFFGNLKINPSLERIVRNSFFNFQDVLLKISEIRINLELTSNLLNSFAINLFNQKENIQSLKESEETLILDFKTIFENNCINTSLNYNIIFDTNALIYIEEKRIEFKKIKYEFKFPQNFKVLIFNKNILESFIKYVYDKKGKIQNILSYLGQLKKITLKIEINKNNELKEEIIDAWFSSRAGKNKELGEFKRSLEINILQYVIENQDENIIIFSEDKEILLPLNELKNKYSTLNKVIVLDINRTKREISFIRKVA